MFEIKDEKVLLDYLRSIDVETEWVRCNLKTLHFIESDKVSYLPPSSLEDLGSYADAIKDADLYMQTRQNQYPIKNTALPSIQKAIGVSGRSLNRLSVHDRRMVMNKCAKVSAGVIYMKVFKGAITGYMENVPPSWLEQYKKQKKGGKKFLKASVNDTNVILEMKNGDTFIQTIISDKTE